MIAEKVIMSLRALRLNFQIHSDRENKKTTKLCPIKSHNYRRLQSPEVTFSSETIPCGKTK